MNIWQASPEKFEPSAGAVEFGQEQWRSHHDGLVLLTRSASACLVAAVLFEGEENGYMGHFSTPFATSREQKSFQLFLSAIRSEHLKRDKPPITAWIGGLNGWQSENVPPTQLANYHRMQDETKDSVVEGFEERVGVTPKIAELKPSEYLSVVEFNLVKGSLSYVVGA
jgi:hypothetical protein